MSTVIRHLPKEARCSTISALLAAAIVLAGCAPKNQSFQRVAAFETAMAEAAKAPASTAAASQGVEAFKALFAKMDALTIREKAVALYAPNAYFNDTLITLRGNEKVADYLLKTAKGTEAVTVQYDDLAVSGNNYYLRWTMDIRTSLQGGETLRSTGITLLRFDPQGRITVHKDYWDSGSNLYEHIPVLGQGIEFVKSRLH